MEKNNCGRLAYYIMRNEIERNNLVNVKVKGSSMLPTLKAGDIVSVSKSIEYKNGDIIAFITHYNGIVIHRIVKIEMNEIVTKGDNNNFCDTPISIQSVIGKVHCCHRNGTEVNLSI